MSTSFKAYNDGPTHEGGVHSSVRVFAGPDEDHRAYAGSLTFRNDEAQDFAARVNGLPPLGTGVDVIPEDELLEAEAERRVTQPSPPEVG